MCKDLWESIPDGVNGKREGLEAGRLVSKGRDRIVHGRKKLSKDPT